MVSPQASPPGQHFSDSASKERIWPVLGPAAHRAAGRNVAWRRSLQLTQKKVVMSSSSLLNSWSRADTKWMHRKQVQICETRDSSTSRRGQVASAPCPTLRGLVFWMPFLKMSKFHLRSVGELCCLGGWLWARIRTCVGPRFSLTLHPFWGAAPRNPRPCACGSCGSALVPEGCPGKQVVSPRLMQHFFHWIVWWGAARQYWKLIWGDSYSYWARMNFGLWAAGGLLLTVWTQVVCVGFNHGATSYGTWREQWSW